MCCFLLLYLSSPVWSLCQKIAIKPAYERLFLSCLRAFFFNDVNDHSSVSFLVFCALTIFILNIFFHFCWKIYDKFLLFIISVLFSLIVRINYLNISEHKCWGETFGKSRLSFKIWLVDLYYIIYIISFAKWCPGKTYSTSYRGEPNFQNLYLSIFIYIFIL